MLKLHVINDGEETALELEEAALGMIIVSPNDSSGGSSNMSYGSDAMLTVKAINP